MENNTLCNRHSLGVNNHTKMYVTYTRIYGWSDYGGESSYQPGYRLENMMWMTLLVYDYIIPGENTMKKINFCKATTIILIINVILSIVLFFVVPDKIAIQWVGTSPSNAVDSYYVFLVPVLSVLFAFTGKPIFTMFLFRLWNRTNEHLVTYLNLCLQVVFLTCEIYIGLYNLCNFNVAISIILIVELMIDVVIGLKLFHNQSI